MRIKEESREKGIYLNCILTKTNIETTELINLLSKELSISSTSIHIAGIKDKRAVTTQWIQFQSVSPKRIINQLEALQQLTPSLQFGNYSYQQSVMNVGDLYGNQFTICVRHIQNTSETRTLLQGQLQQVCEHGYMIRRSDHSSFPNLYGTQRVGNTKYHYQAFMIGIVH